MNLADATDGLLPSSTGDVNYMRNSVKVVVDAYSGTLTYYADDGPDGDPIVRAWAAAFPGLFTSIDEAPQALREHFRYPENLFQMQATQFANYHVTDPQVFYQKQDFWQIPEDPTTAQEAVRRRAPPTVRIRPYYLLLKAPGDTTERFQLVLPLVPQGRPNLVSWIAADSDPENYGQMVAFTFPSGAQRRRARADLLPDQPEPAVLRRAVTARPGRVHGAVRRSAGDPARTMRSCRSSPCTCARHRRRRCPSSSGSSS